METINNEKDLLGVSYYCSQKDDDHLEACSLDQNSSWPLKLLRGVKRVQDKGKPEAETPNAWIKILLSYLIFARKEISKFFISFLFFNQNLAPHRSKGIEMPWCEMKCPTKLTITISPPFCTYFSTQNFLNY